MRDRETIVDKRRHRELWMTVGDPGAVLVDGKIAGTWRTRKSGRKLTVTIKTFESTPARDKKLLADEAQQIAPLRGASSADVVFDSE
jgi:hypothetical protein